MDQKWVLIFVFFVGCISKSICFANDASAHAQEKDRTATFEDVRGSTELLEKNWDDTRKEYAHKFKQQLEVINKRIEVTKKALDGGDPAKRKEINDQLIGLKQSRDTIREVIHEITATSIVKLGSMQKHFKNAKDDTKD